MIKMKGCYCLIIKLSNNSKIKIGKKLGKLDFTKGHYVYVGSAMNSLESRIKRHLSDEKKATLAHRLLIEKSRNHLYNLQ